MDKHDKIRNYIESNMNILDEDIVINDEDNIFQKGYVNSLFAMELLNFIETEFIIKISDEDINIQNFSTVNNILNLVNGKLKN